MSKIVKQTALYSIGEIIPKIIGFLLLPIYTRYFSPADYGILSYTNSVIMFLFVLSTLSLNSYVLRTYYELNTEEERKRLLGNVFLFVMLVNVGVLALSFGFVPILIRHYGLQIPWEPYFKIAVINNFIELFSVIPLVMFRVKQQANNFVLLSLTRVLLQVVLTYYFVVISKDGLIGSYLGNLYPLMGFFFIYWGIMLKQVTLNFNFVQIRTGLRFSLPLLPGALAYLALSFSDRIILERYVPVFEIGIYNVAFILCSALNIVIQSGYKAIEPEVFKRYNTEGFSSFIDQAKPTFFLCIYLGALLIALFSQEALQFMTSKNFHQGYLLVPILMIGVIMTGQNVIYGGILIAEKKTKVVGMATILGSIISMVFNLALIPYFGTLAAAMSSAVSFSVMNLFLYRSMEYVGKDWKPEATALLSFILITFVSFYYFEAQISLKWFLIKLALCMAYSFILFKVFRINRVYKIFKNESI